MQRFSRILLAIGLIGAMSGCDIAEPLGKDTPCGEYLGLTNDQRGAIVRTVGQELGWRDAGNPILGLPSLDTVCAQQNPAITVGQVIELFVKNQ